MSIPALDFDTMTVARDLDALAMDFEGLALDENRPGPYTQLRRAAEQVRFCAALVRNTTYDKAVGQAWLDAGHLTIRKLREALR